MWKAHRVVFRLLSPLHVGHRKIGNVVDTRHYVPGRAIWGGLTSRITRQEGHHDYAGVGRRVQEELAWTYFFPSTQQDAVCSWPWDEDRKEFEWRYLGSFASTALDDGHVADEGSLHEVEYIRPYTRCGQPVYLIGYLFDREGSKLRWRRALEQMQLGGERSYGWGRLCLVGTAPLLDDSCFGIYPSRTDVARPVLEVRANGVLAAHAVALDEKDYHGRVEPLVGRDTNTQTAGFGASPSQAVVCWTPGTRSLRDRTFRIGPYGVWEAI